MTNLTEYTNEQLEGQRFSIMTTIKLMENELSEEVIDLMYGKVGIINNELAKRTEDITKIDSMYV